MNDAYSVWRVPYSVLGVAYCTFPSLCLAVFVRVIRVLIRVRLCYVLPPQCGPGDKDYGQRPDDHPTGAGIAPASKFQQRDKQHEQRKHPKRGAIEQLWPAQSGAIRSKDQPAQDKRTQHGQSRSNDAIGSAPACMGGLQFAAHFFHWVETCHDLGDGCRFVHTLDARFR